MPGDEDAFLRHEGYPRVLPDTANTVEEFLALGRWRRPQVVGPFSNYVSYCVVIVTNDLLRKALQRPRPHTGSGVSTRSMGTISKVAIGTRPTSDVSRQTRVR
jgi:hypothetical protein